MCVSECVSWSLESFVRAEFVSKQACTANKQTNERSHQPRQSRSVGQSGLISASVIILWRLLLLLCHLVKSQTNRCRCVIPNPLEHHGNSLTNRATPEHTLNSHSSSSHKLIKSLRPSAWAAHCPVVPMDPRVVAGLGMYAF